MPEIPAVADLTARAARQWADCNALIADKHADGTL
jgi:hypothetical protein